MPTIPAPRLPPFPFFLAGGILLLASAASAERGIERSFPVDAGGQLTLEADGANVEVISVSKDRASIQVTRGSDSAEAIEDNYIVDMTGQGGDLDIRIERRKTWNPIKNLWRSGSLDITIEVPDSYNLDVNSSGGDIDIDEIEGEVRIRTSGGNLTIADIEGDVWARTSGGRIEIESVTGNIDAGTSGGRIEVNSASGAVTVETSGGSITIGTSKGPLDARTSGGSIDIERAYDSILASTSGGGIRAHLVGQPSKNSELSTSGGSVILYVDTTISVDVDASASGGRVSSELPVRVSDFTTAKSKLRGQINGGGPEVRLRSSGGGIRILAD